LVLDKITIEINFSNNKATMMNKIVEHSLWIQKQGIRFSVFVNVAMKCISLWIKKPLWLSITELKLV
jgi:hypothetical protein